MSDAEPQWDLDAIRARLLARRAELQADAASSAETAAAVELDQSRVGRLSRMDALQVQAMAQQSARQRAQELRRIASALARVEEDEFGCCVTCGGFIETGRLELDPSLPTCVGCARQAEQNSDE
ncbi:TraR/DksA family transcriptional regulator [Magnetofaba australis]|uniref:Putative TraR/DksA family transcriptional regulator n=1 Tax=Magnetofaba australis IT-1 TaxID=1434232 RepID=A0A1Y2K4M0_9PROT|nr:molecular chaperone DnaK [Magnetofaba australis]OSM04186.1 putative TraR/DksA family transcriptional regulator [Magnetofaba australis IT-1]